MIATHAGWTAQAPLWARHGISRRQFLKFCAAMAATLALPERYAARIARALAQARRPALVWLEFQDCAGCTESFLRASRPSVADLVLDLLSVNYHETIMAPAGSAAEKSLMDTVRGEKGRYLVVVEGSIPIKDGGVYCTVGGRTALEIAREVCGNAAATITVGACAFYGGWPAARPNPTGAVGVARAVPGIRVINLPGCPPNAVNITATLVHFLTFGDLPATDQQGRPLFAYGERIHDRCERRAHFDAGRFVEEWGDEGHRQGWCLYKMGCKGPATFHNCPTVRWNDGTSWPVGAGHGCIGCAERDFWDAMSPFYRRLPRVPGVGIHTTADRIGAWIAGGTAAAFAVHGVASAVRARRGPGGPAPAASPAGVPTGPSVEATAEESPGQEPEDA
ncbi:MAG: hydrogenase small subunit [Armatimonadota bacterium]|nr:hydrogenase small subunit [Armatimonadota bacterium]MDR7486284.1 hydrogenase small subunit [Armatimonadota bacterium]MDR7532259.1 hydrogenase small subunit [Armatimonadota bacterium]MDR7537268.1 hydrogenase small subunit [Armatimonadota bacterium]